MFSRRERKGAYQTVKQLMKIFIVFVIVSAVFISGGCSKRQNATSNNKMNRNTGKGTEKPAQETIPQDTTPQTVSGNAIMKDTSAYNCDIEADKRQFDGKVDIVVGDHYYATQINDWYMYFDQYANQTVEIEGYYIGDTHPYDFVGRYGPSCPYCQGGYVCFEILTNEDLTGYQSGKDWIKVTGILREGKDTVVGPFYYIEVLKLEKMDKVGQVTVTN